MARRVGSLEEARGLVALAALELEAEGAAALEDASDPVAWIERRLGEHLWSKQRDIAISVRDHRLTAVHSCHGVGKSHIASRLAAWWIESHPIGEAFVVTTAPTAQQVKAVLWREIGRAHTKGHLRGRVNQTEWWIGNELVAIGHKPADHDPAAFQGIHAAAVLVILDEASGVPQSLWDAASTLASNEESRILAIGNPDDVGSLFARVCAPGSGWSVIGIDAFESPNFSDEVVPNDLRARLVSRSWVAERATDWGEDSPIYAAKVRGQFPSSPTDAVIPLAWVRDCQRDSDDPVIAAAWRERQPIELGVDVGAGGDRTVICLRRGARATIVWRGQTPDQSVVVGEVLSAIRDSGAESVKVDSIGIGWGVGSRLIELREEGRHNAQIYEVNVGGASHDPDRFPRLRDELWWDVGRESCRNRRWDLRELDDGVVAQLIAPRYSRDSSGRIKIERKDETKSRLGRSPDDADALLLAYFDPGTLTDPAWVQRMWPCPCRRGLPFHWTPGRTCPECGRPAPLEDPFAPGPGLWQNFLSTDA